MMSLIKAMPVNKTCSNMNCRAVINAEFHDVVIESPQSQPHSPQPQQKNAEPQEGTASAPTPGPKGIRRDRSSKIRLLFCKPCMMTLMAATDVDVDLVG